ncbi:MAG TPA: hypothetical protein VMO88_11410, partial [Acidimicrobiales bacterium]|nr:hypothetical protein [Acidimicrobiales bacterium]
PFRQAHAVVGALVRDSAERGVPLAELVQAHPALGAEALSLLEPGVAVTRRTTPGGAGPVPVADQMKRFSHRLDVDGQRLERVAAHKVGAAGGSPIAGPPKTGQAGARSSERTRKERSPRTGSSKAGAASSGASGAGASSSGSASPPKP